METKQNSNPISQGIEALIKQLKEEGVQSGKVEAEKLIKEAEEDANDLLVKAQLQAKSLLDDAYQTIEKEKKAAKEALRLAAQNMRLELRQNLKDRFSQEVRRLVHKELNNEEMIRQLIMVVAMNTKEQIKSFNAQRIEIQLPETCLDFAQIRKQPDLLDKDPLKNLVQSLTKQMLKEGMSVVINPDAKKPAGIKVSLVEEEIVLDLSEEAVSALLIKHMQPRFRALLEGLLQ